MLFGHPGLWMMRLDLTGTQNASEHMAQKQLALFLCAGWCEIDHGSDLGFFFFFKFHYLWKISWNIPDLENHIQAFIFYFFSFGLLSRACTILVILQKYSESLCIFDLSHHLHAVSLRLEKYTFFSWKLWTFQMLTTFTSRIQRPWW